MNRAVFLDRDGVINRAVIVKGKPFPPNSLDELEILPGVSEAVRAMKAAGLRAIVVTNQPDVATGKQQRSVVDAMHVRLREYLELDDIYVCYHTDAHRCACRKPSPGMLLEAAKRWDIDLSGSFMVGDRWRDVEAGQKAGCRTFWVRGEEYLEKEPTDPDWIVGSLREASVQICSLIHADSGQWPVVSGQEI
jgi:D-glycero-D-manno-heptose 1,7-bisphosphate phosphatase